MIKLRYNIAPVPASRPRVARWGVYYGKNYTKFRKQMERLVRAGKQYLLVGNLKAELTFAIGVPASYSKNKKQQALSGVWSNARMDLDNLEKAVYDSLTGHIYRDDSQIVEQTSRKIWAECEPYIEVIIEKINGSRTNHQRSGN